MGPCTSTYSLIRSWLSPPCKNLPHVHFHCAAAGRRPCWEGAWCTYSGSLNPLMSSEQAQSLQRSGRRMCVVSFSNPDKNCNFIMQSSPFLKFVATIIYFLFLHVSVSYMHTLEICPYCGTFVNKQLDGWAIIWHMWLGYQLHELQCLFTELVKCGSLS